MAVIFAHKDGGTVTVTAGVQADLKSDASFTLEARDTSQNVVAIADSRYFVAEIA